MGSFNETVLYVDWFCCQLLYKVIQQLEEMRKKSPIAESTLFYSHNTH
jgi:hypothetical protein